MTAQSKPVIKTYFESLHKEEWKAIPQNPIYEASTLGRIRNTKTGKFIVPVVWGNRGHVAVKIGGGRKASKQYVHRLVLSAHVGLPIESQIACHKNDVKTDNRLSNLYWGTYKTNAQDAIRLGTFCYVQPEHTTKYSDEIITNIRKEYTGKRGEQSALAKKHNMSVSNVNLIVNNKARVK